MSVFESGKVRALLAYLAVESQQPHSREALAELLWPNHPEGSTCRQSSIAAAGWIGSAVRAAVDLGFECLVAADACATMDLVFSEQLVPAAHVHAAFLAALNAGYARVVGTDELLEQI